MNVLLPGSIAMAAIIVASNILVQYPMGGYLTWGALTYPLAFLVGDLTNRVQGAAAARVVVGAGFVVGIFCSLLTPLVTLRVAIASGAAFLVAQLLDIAVFDSLRRRKWWVAPLVSSVAGSTLDTAIFFTTAFSAALIWLEPGNDVSWATTATPLLGLGPDAPFWVSLAIADWAVKLVLALLTLLPFKLFVAKLIAPIA